MGRPKLCDVTPMEGKYSFENKRKRKNEMERERYKRLKEGNAEKSRVLRKNDPERSEVDLPENLLEYTVEFVETTNDTSALNLVDVALGVVVPDGPHTVHSNGTVADSHSIPNEVSRPSASNINKRETHVHHVGAFKNLKQQMKQTETVVNLGTRYRYRLLTKIRKACQQLIGNGMSINIIYAGINKDASITFGSHQFGALAEELSQSKGAIELMENWKAKAHEKLRPWLENNRAFDESQNSNKNKTEGNLLASVPSEDSIEISPIPGPSYVEGIVETDL